MKNQLMRGIAAILLVIPVSADNSVNIVGAARNATNAMLSAGAQEAVRVQQLESRLDERQFSAMQQLNARNAAFTLPTSDQPATPPAASGGATEAPSAPASSASGSSVAPSAPASSASGSSVAPSAPASSASGSSVAPSANGRINVAQLGSGASELVDSKLDELGNNLRNVEELTSRFQQNPSDENKTSLTAGLQNYFIIKNTLEQLDGLNEDQAGLLRLIGGDHFNNNVRINVAPVMEGVDQNTVDEQFLQSLTRAENSPENPSVDTSSEGGSETRTGEVDTTPEETPVSPEEAIMASCGGNFGLSDKGALMARLASVECSQALQADPAKAVLVQQVMWDLSNSRGSSLLLGRGGPGERIASLRDALGVNIGSNLPPALDIRARQRAIASTSLPNPDTGNAGGRPVIDQMGNNSDRD